MAWNPTPVTESWMALGTIGTVVSVFNITDALMDKRALQMAGKTSKALHDMAQNGIRVEALRLSKMIAIMAVGLTAIFTTPAITTAQRKALHIPYWTKTSIMLTSLLFYIIGVIVAQAVLDAKLRHRFYRNHTESRTHEVTAELIAQRTAELLLGDTPKEEEEDGQSKHS